MAHIIDLTLFYGGIAGAPTAELPFAGSSFDVQEGTLRRAVFGVPEAVSRADVRPAGVVPREKGLGTPTATYRALGLPQGVARKATFGVARTLTGKVVLCAGVASRGAELGQVSAATTASASVSGVVAPASSVGVLSTSYTAAIGASGFVRQGGVGLPRVALRVFPDGLLRRAAIGSAQALSGLAVDADSAGSRVYALGGIAVRSGVDVATRGIANSYTTGLLAVAPAVTARFAGFATAYAVGVPSVGKSALVELDGIAQREHAVGNARALSAVRFAVRGAENAPATLGGVLLETSALAEPKGIARKALLGQPRIALRVFPDGYGRRASFGRLEAYSQVETWAASIAERRKAVGSALALSAVQFKVQSAENSPAVFGGITVSTAVEVGPRGVAEPTTVGVPRFAIRIFPASVEYAADLGVPLVHSSTTVALASAPLRMPTVGRTTTRTAVRVSAQSAGGRSSELGKVLAATSADVALAGIRQAWTTGRPSVAIRVFPAGMRLTAGYGRPTASSVRNVSVRGIAGNAPTLGATRFVSAVTLRVPGVGRKPVGSGSIAVTTESHARPLGFVERVGFGRPSLAIEIAPSFVPHTRAIGEMRLVPAHTTKLDGVAASPSAGLPLVGFGLVVAPAGLGAQARDFGTATFAWRKCPRFDRSAVLMQASEVDARLRPAPAMPQVWRGEARIRRDCHMDAALARVLERRTVARLKNEARAAVCRKEQI